MDGDVLQDFDFDSFLNQDGDIGNGFNSNAEPSPRHHSRHTSTGDSFAYNSPPIFSPGYTSHGYYATAGARENQSLRLNKGSRRSPPIDAYIVESPSPPPVPKSARKPILQTHSSAPPTLAALSDSRRTLSRSKMQGYPAKPANTLFRTPPFRSGDRREGSRSETESDSDSDSAPQPQRSSYKPLQHRDKEERRWEQPKGGMNDIPGMGDVWDKKRERRYNSEGEDLEKGSEEMEKVIMATMRKRTMSKVSSTTARTGGSFGSIDFSKLGGSDKDVPEIEPQVTTRELSKIRQKSYDENESSSDAPESVIHTFRPKVPLRKNATRGYFENIKHAPRYTSDNIIYTSSQHTARKGVKEELGQRTTSLESGLSEQDFRPHHKVSRGVKRQAQGEKYTSHRGSKVRDLNNEPYMDDRDESDLQDRPRSPPRRFAKVFDDPVPIGARTYTQADPRAIPSRVDPVAAVYQAGKIDADAERNNLIERERYSPSPRQTGPLVNLPLIGTNQPFKESRPGVTYGEQGWRPPSPSHEHYIDGRYPAEQTVDEREFQPRPDYARQKLEAEEYIERFPYVQRTERRVPGFRYADTFVPRPRQYLPGPSRVDNERIAMNGYGTSHSQRSSCSSIYICPTISQDNTLGEQARKSKLLAGYGQRLQRPAFSNFAEKQPLESQEDLPTRSRISYGRDSRGRVDPTSNGMPPVTV